MLNPIIIVNYDFSNQNQETWSVIVVVFQSIFHSEIHQNNIVFIFKKLFLTLTHQNDLKTSKNINLKQIKK
jgi:hypothetical protein